MKELSTLALLAWGLIAVPGVLGQNAGLKNNVECPIKDQARYDKIIQDRNPPIWNNVYPATRWFTAPTTSALHQAAYVFDVPRVKCLLTVAKFNPNLKVPWYMAPTNEEAGNLPVYSPIPQQWPLGAALRLDQLFQTKNVSDEMVATILLLLKAGADPNVDFFNNTPPLNYITYYIEGSYMPPAALTIAKALVAAGAKIDHVVWDGEWTPLDALQLLPKHQNKFCKDAGFKQFLDFLLSKGADAQRTLDHFDNNPENWAGCPQLLQWMKKAAAAQKATRAAAAGAAQKQG